MNNNCNNCVNSILNLNEGYLIEYDIEFPKEYNNYYNDLPLAPENIVIDPTWLSPIQRKSGKSNELHSIDKNTRLAPNLFNKTHCIIFR